MLPPALAPSDPKPPIYSPLAIWGFATFFTPLVGGLLAYKALRTAGQPVAARRLLQLGFGLLAAYFVFRYGLHWLFRLTYQQDGAGWLNSLAASGLDLPFPVLFGGAGYYLKREVEKALPAADTYPRKEIKQPLTTCLLIFGLPFGLFIVFVWAISHMGP